MKQPFILIYFKQTNFSIAHKIMQGKLNKVKLQKTKSTYLGCSDSSQRRLKLLLL